MYANFLVKMKRDYNQEVLSTVINSIGDNKLEFSSKILDKDQGIYIINFYSNTNINAYKYEQALKNYIENIKNICEYISILYDSTTQKRMELISGKIYTIERNFRNLIEILFLKLEGIGWFKKYYKGLKRNRKKERGSFVEYLNNPLDDLDFIDLNDFVKNFLYEKNEVLLLEKVDEIGFQIEEVRKKLKITNENVEKIHNDIEILKNYVNEKRKGKKISEIYDCISVTDTEYWKELYDLRCLWAHNNCYLTCEEFDDFNKIYCEIEHSINNEITHLILYEGKNIIFDGNKIKITFESYKNEGIDKYILKFLDNINKIQLLKNDANYLDIEKLIKIIEKNYLENSEELQFETSAFFIMDEIKTKIQLVEKEVKKFKDEDINILEEACKKISFSFNRISGCVEQISDHDMYLKTIFPKNN
ncbi:hypothetical protein [Clostridium sp. VAP51]|uniref:hypothetical protein n=1 Tax=Clostridium sp. VAP51 TaxID=2949978 RepID=UPI002079E212|nr:hypothetical protein [Clostridium sp. VAP51]